MAKKKVKKKVARKKRRKAAPKKQAGKKRKRRAKPVQVKGDYSAAELLAAVQKLEEITEEVREVASQLIRTEALQADLLGNRTKQMKERDVLEGRTAVLTGARNKAAAELAGVSKGIAALTKELDALDKTIEKGDALAETLAVKKAALVSERKSLAAVGADLQARQKKCKTDIARLKALKKELIS
jgi:archaellum component FlaC